jgi:hypothetical protein
MLKLFYFRASKSEVVLPLKPNPSKQFLVGDKLDSKLLWSQKHKKLLNKIRRGEHSLPNEDYEQHHVSDTLQLEFKNLAEGNAQCTELVSLDF